MNDNESPLKLTAESGPITADNGAVVAQTAIAKGVDTSEFRLSVAGLAMAVLIGIGTALASMPAPYMFVGAGILGGLSVFGYGVSRGLAKLNAIPVVPRVP